MSEAAPALVSQSGHEIRYEIALDAASARVNVNQGAYLSGRITNRSDHPLILVSDSPPYDAGGIRLGGRFSGTGQTVTKMVETRGIVAKRVLGPDETSSFTLSLPRGLLDDGVYSTDVSLVIENVGWFPSIEEKFFAFSVIVDSSLVESVAYLDITDILFFLAVHDNVSGIQRVISQIILALNDAPHLFGGKFAFCTVDAPSQVRILPTLALVKLFNYLKSGNPSRPELNQLLQLCQDGHHVEPQAGDRFVILGAFWICPNYIPVAIRLRAAGVSLGLYVYDLIPLNHREFFMEMNAGGFDRLFPELLTMVDFALTISDYVAEEVRVFGKEILHREFPIRSVKLAHELDHKSTHVKTTEDVANVIRQPFVLSVGTLEIRKNHQYLVSIWQRLLKKYPPDVIPDLVFVGRWGWRIDELRASLEGSNFLNGKVVVLDHVNDVELVELYRNCMFTMFPSFTEGWGLPIGESLMYGKPCIASNLTSIPEVGGEFADYVDPFNVSDGFEKVSKWIFDPAALRERADHIGSAFVPRSWSAVAADLGSAIREAGGRPVERRASCRIHPLEIVPVGTRAAYQRAKGDLRAMTFPMLCIEGWDGIEGWGVWARQQTAILQFSILGQTRGSLFRLALKLELPDPDAYGRVTVVSAGYESIIDLNIAESRWYFATVKADEDGIFTIRLRFSGRVQQVDPLRKVFFGLQAVAVSETDTVSDRLTLMESIISHG